MLENKHANPIPSRPGLSISSDAPFLLSLSLALLVSLCAGHLTAAAPGADEVVAEIGGASLSRGDLEDFARVELLEIDRQRHATLEAALGRLVEKRLLELEASVRKTTVSGLLADEVASAVEPVTGEQVEAWYAANRSRVRQPKEAVADQIAAYLRQQQVETANRKLVEDLRRRHGVRSFLEPLRIGLESAGFPSKGPEAAPISIVEFSDFQCPVCRRVNPDLERLRETYDGKVRLIFRQFPLRAIHSQAQGAAEASLCAREQGKFWEMHDALFDKQNQLSAENFKIWAKEIGLDGESFARCLDSGRHEDAVQSDLDAGELAGVRGTPWIFVNGRPVQLVSGIPAFDSLSKVVDDELERVARRETASQ